MVNQQPKKIIIELDRKSVKAFYKGDDKLYGVGKTKSEAVAALYSYTIGKLIIDNPGQFGFEIIDKT